MQYFKRIGHLQAYIQYQKSLGRSIGFAPTMGALHDGHLELIRAARNQTDVTVCSIFVNPTQFNEASDLEKYPRTLEKDINLLYDQGLEVLFVPEVKDIYPEDKIYTPEVDFGSLVEIMEGSFRPGHFKGVAQVVYRLLDIVHPDQLFMGQKDYQQWTIIHHMIRQLEMPVELVMVNTQREKDGLAMSSRNTRLTKTWRKKAPLIHEILEKTKDAITVYQSIEKIETLSKKELDNAGFKTEYFSIVDGYTLQSIEDPNTHEKIVACVAAWAGDVRLIDNKILKG